MWRDYAAVTIITILGGVLGVTGMRHAFRRHREGEDFLALLDANPMPFTFISRLLLKATKMLFPKRMYVIAYKAFAFLFGLLMFALIFLAWELAF